MILEPDIALHNQSRMTERRLAAGTREGRLGEQEPCLPSALPASEGQLLRESGLGRRRRRVLFALTELEYPTPTLRRVAAMATAIEGNLYIVRVLSSRSSVEPRDNFDDERARLAMGGTIAWWRRTLRLPFGHENIRVRTGDFAGEVSAHARALNVSCVVLGPTQAGRAGTMLTLTRACRQPVFSTPGAGEEWAALLVAAKSADGGS